jgi:hypothetical protein
VGPLRLGLEGRVGEDVAGGPAQRVQERLVRRPLGQGVLQAVDAVFDVGEEDVLLGGEVGEEGARRHVGGLGDVGHGGGLEPAFGEQPQGGLDQRPAGSGLLALAQ